MNKQLITIFSIFSITCLGMVSAQESKSFLPEVKKESLTFSSEDNKFKLTFNGRIQADGAMFFGEDYQPIGNGVGFRRVRLGATAAFGKRLSGKIEMDLTDGGFSLKDCFIKYAFPNGLYFRAGNFKEFWHGCNDLLGRFVVHGKGERGICICSGISYRCTGNLGT